MERLEKGRPKLILKATHDIGTLMEGLKIQHGSLHLEIDELNHTNLQYFFFFSINGIASPSSGPPVHCTPLLLKGEVHRHQSGAPFVVCDAIIGDGGARKAISNRHPFCFARESPKECIAKWGSSSSSTLSLCRPLKPSLTLPRANI